MSPQQLSRQRSGYLLITTDSVIAHCKEERLARNLQSYQSIKSKDAADRSRKHRRNARRRELAAARRMTLQQFADKILEVNGITSTLSAKKIVAIYNATVFHPDFPTGM